MLNIRGKEFPGKDKSRHKVVRSEQVRLLEQEGAGKWGWGWTEQSEKTVGRGQKDDDDDNNVCAVCKRLGNDAAHTGVDAFMVSFATDFPCYFFIVLN